MISLNTIPAKLALAGLVLLGAAGVALAAIRTLDSMLDEARADGRQERDLYWRGEVEAMKAAAQAEINTMLIQTMAAQDAARDKVAALEAKAAELETTNAALPNGDACGLGRDRVRLLNQR